MDTKNTDRREFLSTCTKAAMGCFASAFIPGILSAETPQPSPKIALIIDDIGYSYSQLERFFRVEIPITFSVLPKLRNSLYLSSEIYFRGYDVMLHQPMEPQNSSYNPGPGALYVGYEKERTRDIIETNLDGIPYAIGIEQPYGIALDGIRTGYPAIS